MERFNIVRIRPISHIFGIVFKTDITRRMDEKGWGELLDLS